MKKKAAIYCRLSEEDRKKQDPAQESESIKNQILMLTQYAREKGWEIYDIYSDDNWTGADRTRPSFCRMLKDAESKKFDIILCKTQSRFSRELEMVEKYIHGLFPIWGIRFISVVDNGDSDKPGNKKSRQIHALVDEWYLEDMSENIKSVLTSRRKNGYYIGSTPLYGYCKDPERKGHLIIDEEAAEVVRLVFHSFAQGMGKTAIARMLNEKGIPNPTEYKRRKGILSRSPSRKGGTLWKYFAISNMLKNEMYLGNLVQAKYGSVSYKTHANKPRPKEEWIRCEGTHKAIIDRELWDVVQSILKERAKPFASGEVGIFARKVRCKHCGYTMRSSKSHGKCYLKCSTRNVDKEACEGSFVPVADLEKIIFHEWRFLTDQYLDIEMLVKRAEVCGDDYDRKRRWEEKRKQAQKELEKNKEAMKNLYLDKITQFISPQQYLQLSSSLEEDRKRLMSQTEKCEEEILGMKKNARNQKTKSEIVWEYVKTEKLNRTIVEQWIDYIEVSKKDVETGKVQINIYWNF